MTTQENTQPKPRIADYTDYRAYLRAMIDYLRATRRGFSYRNFSRLAGFSSPNFLKLVADGKRNLSISSIQQFARGLALDDHEREAFEALVLLNQARTDEDRNRFFHRLQQLTERAPAARLRGDQFEVYQRWYALPIRELVRLPDFREDPVWIAARLRPRIKPSQAVRALELLQRLGLLVRSPGDGRLQVAEPSISTGPEVTSLAVRNFHRSLMKVAERSLERVPRAERNFTSVTIPLSRDDFPEAVRLVAELRQKLLALSDDGLERGDEHEVVHAVFQLFPVTDRRQPSRKT